MEYWEVRRVANGFIVNTPGDPARMAPRGPEYVFRTADQVGKFIEKSSQTK